MINKFHQTHETSLDRNILESTNRSSSIHHIHVRLSIVRRDPRSKWPHFPRRLSRSHPPDPAVVIDPVTCIASIRLSRDRRNVSPWGWRRIRSFRFDVCEISSVKESMCGGEIALVLSVCDVRRMREEGKDPLKLPVSTETSLSEG